MAKAKKETKGSQRHRKELAAFSSIPLEVQTKINKALILEHRKGVFQKRSQVAPFV